MSGVASAVVSSVLFASLFILAVYVLVFFECRFLFFPSLRRSCRRKIIRFFTRREMRRDYLLDLCLERGYVPPKYVDCGKDLIFTRVALDHPAELFKLWYESHKVVREVVKGWDNLKANDQAQGQLPAKEDA